MYLEIFLADFAVFRAFLGISRDFAEIPEFHGSATTRNIRSPDKMFYVRGFHSETNTDPWVFALCYFYEMPFFIFDLLSWTPFAAPAIPVSEEAGETIWCAMNTVSTCRSKFNFFNYLVIFRHYLTGNGKVSCILATICDWFPKNILYIIHYKQGFW